MAIRRQRGFTLVLLVAAIASLAALGTMQVLKARANETERVREVERRFDRIETALASFVIQMQHLPCPADPTADTGESVTAGPNNCNNAARTVPWKTLGLRREDGLDSWGWKISYRVFDGGQGLTRDEGATMVKCHTDNPPPPPAPPPHTPQAGKCRDTYSTTRAEYLAVKTLFTVNDNGTNVGRVAYVLISHGPTGQGAYTASGVATMDPVSADEISNKNVNGPFVKKPASGVTVAAADANHFDDLVRYKEFLELMTQTGLRERDWP